MLVEVEPDAVPNFLAKFLLVDFAGDGDSVNADAWAIMVVGVDPDCEDPRTGNIYITDMVLTPIKELHAIDKIVKMYLRDYDIQALCIEKTQSKVLGIHVAGILEEKHGRPISEEDKTLIYLKPAGRNKKMRISTALELPFIQEGIISEEI